MTWELKPEAREGNYANVILAQQEENEENAAGSDIDDVQFENV